jgi:2-keto-4-pentenoate hydratase/2-oxohepta-3-ene-1,7-dioic acid hydratase in catechol pathway
VFQIERSGGQWNKGKGCETFGPIGPWFVTKDEVRDPQNLIMWLDVNGEKRQRGNTKTMIFGCEQYQTRCSQPVGRGVNARLTMKRPANGRLRPHVPVHCAWK